MDHFKKCFNGESPCTFKFNIKGGRGREERGHRKALDITRIFFVPLTFNSVEKDEVPALLVAVQV